MLRVKRFFGSVASKSSLVQSDPATASGTVYGGIHTVTLIPGDGVGLELATSVKTIFSSCGVPVEWEEFHVSGHTDVSKDSEISQAMASVRKNKVCLKGLFYTPIKKSGRVSWNGLVRKELDVYASTTLVKNLPGSWKVRHKDIDFAIIRENTEGEYSGMEHSPVPGVVESLKVSTRAKTERIAKYAFDFALKNNRKKVHIIHKANIMYILIIVGNWEMDCF